MRYLACGKPNCACHKDPAQRHGPYLYRSTKMEGKTVSKAISGSDAKIVQQWVANRALLESIVEQVKEIAQEAFQAASHILSEETTEAFLHKKP
jgi:oligoendopeptidase F